MANPAVNVGIPGTIAHAPPAVMAAAQGTPTNAVPFTASTNVAHNINNTVRGRSPSFMRLIALVHKPRLDDQDFTTIIRTLTPTPLVAETVIVYYLAENQYRQALDFWRALLIRFPNTSYQVRAIEHLKSKSIYSSEAARCTIGATDDLGDRANMLLGVCRQRWFVEEQIRVLKVRLGL